MGQAVDSDNGVTFRLPRKHSTDAQGWSNSFMSLSIAGRRWEESEDAYARRPHVSSRLWMWETQL